MNASITWGPGVPMARTKDWEKFSSKVPLEGGQEKALAKRFCLMKADVTDRHGIKECFLFDRTTDTMHPLETVSTLGWPEEQALKLLIDLVLLNPIDLVLPRRDIHTQTAAEMFGIPPDQVTTEQRNAAKNINFGICYGKKTLT